MNSNPFYWFTIWHNGIEHKINKGIIGDRAKRQFQLIRWAAIYGLGDEDVAKELCENKSNDEYENEFLKTLYEVGMRHDSNKTEIADLISKIAKLEEILIRKDKQIEVDDKQIDDLFSLLNASREETANLKGITFIPIFRGAPK